MSNRQARPSKQDSRNLFVSVKCVEISGGCWKSSNVLVILQIVHTPLRKGSRIDHLVPKTSRISATCRISGAGIDTSLEAQRMNLVNPPIDSTREL